MWENDNDWTGFEWIDVNNNHQSILIFCRKARNTKNFLIVLINFLPLSYQNYRLGVPAEGKYKEILNSDQEIYGGQNLVNPQPISTDNIPWHGRRFSLTINVAPLAIIILKPGLNRKALEEPTRCLQVKKALNGPI